MTETQSKSSDSKPLTFLSRALKWALRILLKVVLPIAIILFGVGFYRHQMDTRPEAQRRRPQRAARLVTVETFDKETRRAVVVAMGTVRPAVEITLTPEVAGLVVYKDPDVIPGGLIEKGEVLYRIDSRDYETIVQQRQSELARAKLELKLEQGSQTIAQQEYAMLGEEIDEQDRELVLRKPQLEHARQAVAAAEAALARAKLDVKRCTIRAPFNAVVKVKGADIGARVSATAPLAVLTGTDEYWVEALAPMDQLRWIQFPDRTQTEGSRVRIDNPAVWRHGEYRQGRVLRLMGQLEEAGRMAQLIISVSDPLGLDGEPDTPPLLIGGYMRVEIEGHSIPDVVVLPRAYLRDGGNVWVMNDEDNLEIRAVEIVFRGRDAVYVAGGLVGGERVVTTDLSAAVDGMPLRLEEFEFDAEELLQ